MLCTIHLVWTTIEANSIRMSYIEKWEGKKKSHVDVNWIILDIIQLNHKKPYRYLTRNPILLRNMKAPINFRRSKCQVTCIKKHILFSQFLGTTCVQIVHQWDSGEVINWLRRNNYSHLQNWFLSYNGEDLLGLKRIAAQAPNSSLATRAGVRVQVAVGMIRFKNMLDAII